jgi:ribosomal protein L40E
MENLDCMSHEDLFAFAARYQYYNHAKAAELFGEEHKRQRNAYRDADNYAWNKYTAMSCRLRGDVQSALQYESICERIYAKLPPFARW